MCRSFGFETLLGIQQIQQRTFRTTVGHCQFAHCSPSYKRQNQMADNPQRRPTPAGTHLGYQRASYYGKRTTAITRLRRVMLQSVKNAPPQLGVHYFVMPLPHGVAGGETNFKWPAVV
jgi:hypothetical protein